MTEKGGGRFPQMFGEEFVKAYERGVAEYQRHDREGTAEPAKVSAEEDQAIDPGLMATQKLDGPVIAESVGADQPFDEDSIVEAVSLTDADDSDQSFIEELDNSLAEEIKRDQLKA
jgi:hypothetical protein